MIYFLTDWQTEQPQLESNIVFNVSQIFCEGALETKVINAQLCPFSNYFTNPFEFYDSEHFINLLDPVTEHFALSYAPLTLSDLQFPTTWEKTYTRKNVLLSEGGIIKAEVFFNSFGFVSQVHYHSHLGKEIHIYSEKGVLLTKKVIDSSGVRVEQQVFDEGGQVILTQWRDYVFIEKNYQKRFKKITYQSFKEVCIELINGALVKFNSKEDQLIIDGTSEWLMSLVEGFEFPESIVYIFTGPTQTCISQLNLHFNLIEKGKLIISDNEDLQKICHSLSLYQSIKGKVKIMALYPTTLALGESNSTLEEYFYWQIERFDAHESQLLKKFLRMKLETRELCLTIEILNNEEKEAQKVLTHFISNSFKINVQSTDFELVKQYYEALKNEEMTPALRELFNKTKHGNPEFGRVIEAYLFYAGVTFIKRSNVQDLKKAFQSARVFIDQREDYQFLNHSLAVSAGLPILSKTPSPYLMEGENGFIFKDDHQLLEDVQYYLSQPDHWNKNLVESVSVIEKNSAEALVEKWKGVLK